MIQALFIMLYGMAGAAFAQTIAVGLITLIGLGPSKPSRPGWSEEQLAAIRRASD